MSKWINKIWYEARWSSCWLWPFSALFAVVIFCRKKFFELGLMPRYRSSLPVVVVGNITVGGAGKTPAVLALIEILQRAGLKPGVISLGYGGDYSEDVVRVTVDKTAQEIGDEPKMIQQKTGVPVVVARKRPLAAQYLEQHGEVDVIIADDGLQHYPLMRDVEIAVIDGARLLGNGFLLPAGPLRELPSRLNTVDFKLLQGTQSVEGAYAMTLEVEHIHAFDASLAQALQPGASVIGMAGIGYPDRFKKTLESHGFHISSFHAFADHKPYQAEDIKALCKEGIPVIMTEKDAVKCFDLEDLPRHNLYYLTVKPKIDATFAQQFVTTLRKKAYAL